MGRSTAPTDADWARVLHALRALLADQEQERCLLERALANSSHEMRALYQDLRATADQLRDDHRQLAAANSVLEATLESTADGILVVSSDGQISSFNGRFAQMWGIPEQLLRSGDDQAAIRFVESQLKEPEAFVAKIAALHRTPRACSRDTLEFSDGKVFERRSLPQELDGEVIGRVWSFRDVTAEHRLRAELRHSALHDSLTGLANRAAFDHLLATALRRRSQEGGHLAAVVVDLDGFKHINDSLGHQSGDAVLIATAQRFRSAFPEADTIARFGGDEFVMLVDDVTCAEQAAHLGERLLEVLAAPIDLGDRQVAMGVSVGIAIAPEDSVAAARILGQADAAMYQAKRDGKSRYQLFEPAIHQLTMERHHLALDLRGAVTNGELSVCYQPIVDVRDGRVVSFEALARWRHPLRGSVPPDVFIPLAEESGLIHDIGEHVLQTACRQAQRWRADPGPADLSIAVNVSTRQLLEPAFATSVDEALTGAGLDPGALTLEITESAFAENTSRVIATLTQLRSLGVRIAIDDFGTGYSSFAALVNLPVDTIKIDKAFVAGLSDPRGHGLVQAIIGLADTLGLRSVAEGVEEPQQHESLRRLGCAHSQGFFFARPVLAEEAVTFLRERSAATLPRARQSQSHVKISQLRS